MEAVSAPETSVYFYETARRNISESCHFQTVRYVSYVLWQISINKMKRKFWVDHVGTRRTTCGHVTR
jgi:hypothetical protein